ncbi:MAG: hypothetical protein KGR19_04655 [Acidobacteria bacterium]|nr:hypothetical protein [Acidobacteriota bacterium]
MRQALCAALAASALALLPATALADWYFPTALSDASLQVADVPGSFFVNGARERQLSYASGSKTRRFEACVDKDGNKVFGARPGQHENSMVVLYQEGSGSDTKAERAVSSDIYAYASRAAALKAWKQLNRDRRRCAPKAGTQVPFQGVDVDVDARQTLKSLPRRSGMPGYTLEQHVAADVAAGSPGGLSLWVGGFTAYRQVGRAIVRAQFANYSTVSASGAALTDEYRSFTTDEALRVARRLR